MSQLRRSRESVGVSGPLEGHRCEPTHRVAFTSPTLPSNVGRGVDSPAGTALTPTYIGVRLVA